MDIITLSHGSGGRKTNKLIEELFYKYFNNEYLNQKNDSTVLPKIDGKIAISTDSFVINPIFFPGGDIGKLAICGTVNDVAMSGAKPIYLSVSFILEEGLLLSELETIVASMSKTAKEANVRIVTGDTKVVERGSVDKIYINTTGIGIIEDESKYLGGNMVSEGDVVIISGTLGDHGMCIMNCRDELGFENSIKSDCTLLNKLIDTILNTSRKVKVLRDPTRGGVATTLNEIAQHSNISFEINEEDIPINIQVKAMCDILGIDPLFVANEGKLIVIVDPMDSEKVLNAIKNSSVGNDARIIGIAVKDEYEKVYLKTEFGGKRIVDMAEGELMIRIC